MAIYYASIITQNSMNTLHMNCSLCFPGLKRRQWGQSKESGINEISNHPKLKVPNPRPLYLRQAKLLSGNLACPSVIIIGNKPH